LARNGTEVFNANYAGRRHSVRRSRHVDSRIQPCSRRISYHLEKLGRE
jgi:hypothetical protein